MATNQKPIETQEFGTLYVNADTPDPQPGLANPAPDPPKPTGLDLYRAGGDVGLGESPQTRAAKAAAGADGSAPAGPEAAQVPEIPAGAKPTRQGASERGIADYRIGWNGKTGSVTLDGNDVYKPNIVIDGTSYADDEALNKIAEQAYANRNDPLKAARDYVTANGVPSGAVDWDGSNVTIGGRSIKPTFVRNGVAYIPTSQLDAAVAAYKDSTDIKTNNAVYDESKHQRNRLENMLEKLRQRPEFTYDPEQDKAFGMYRDLGERLAEAAYRRTLEHNSSGVQNASGAVLGQAMAARNNMLERLAGEVGNYYDRAYERYNDDYDRQRQSYSDAYDLFNDFYNKQYQANRDTIGDYQTAQANERQIKQQDFNNEITLRQLAMQYATHLLQSQGLDIANQGALIDNEGKSIANQGAIIDNEGKVLDNTGRQLTNEGRTLENESRRLNNESVQANNILTRAYNRGGYLLPEEADILGIRNYTIGEDGYIHKADGTPFLAWDPELTYTGALAKAQAYAQASAQLQAQKEYGQLK